MNRSLKKVAGILLVVAVLSGGTPFGASSARAQEKSSSLAQQIQGSWILVSIYNEQDGKKVDAAEAPFAERQNRRPMTAKPQLR